MEKNYPTEGDLKGANNSGKLLERVARLSFSGFGFCGREDQTPARRDKRVLIAPPSSATHEFISFTRFEKIVASLAPKDN
jgi:hypothetical protein